MAWGTSWVDSELNSILSGDRGPVTLHLHTGDPGSSGAHEVPGYSPPVVTGLWEPSEEGRARNAATLVVSGLPEVTVTHVSLRAGGMQFLGGPCSQPVHIATGGRLEIPPGQMVVRIGSGMEPGDGDNDLEQARLIVPADRRTVWNPGIPGGIPRERQVFRDFRTNPGTLTLDGTGSHNALINSVLDAAGDAFDATGIIQEVILPAGTIRTTSRIILRRSGVVLRGQGWNTRIRLDSDELVAIGVQRNWFLGESSTIGPWHLAADGVKGSYEIRLTNADASNIQIGDILCIDMEDDARIAKEYFGGWIFDKRQTYFATQGPPIRSYHGTVTSVEVDETAQRAYLSISDNPGSEDILYKFVTNNGSNYRILAVEPGRLTVSWRPGDPIPVAGPYSVHMYRSVASMIEITGKEVGPTHTTLRLRDPLHMDFTVARRAQVWHLATKWTPQRPTMEGTHWCGVEDLYVTGGGVQLTRAAYSWISNVEVDGFPGTQNIGSYTNPGGCGDVSIMLFQAYRCEVRGCYVHHKRIIGQNSGGYLLTLYTYTSECLVEDNIVVFGNKGILGNMCGGGNVVAYNYVDGPATFSWAAGWQEGAIDASHRTYPHNMLVEGNDTTNLTVDTSHGSSAFHVFFRNFSRGRSLEKLTDAYPYVPATDSAYRRAAGVDGGHHESTWIGNVLLADETAPTRVYQRDHTTGPMLGDAAVWRIGQVYQQSGDIVDDGTALAFLYRHYNWDNVTGGIADMDPNNTVPLPLSLYLRRKPDWWPAGMQWPPVNPDGATENERYAGIPARLRYEQIKRGG